VPGTPYVLTVDTGPDDHAVRAVDTSKIGGGTSPVTGAVKFSPPSWLNSGIAFVPPGRAYVATAFGVVQALSFDGATGALAKDDAASLVLPAQPDGEAPWYASGVAASPDGKRLVVSSVNEKEVVVFDIDPGSPGYKSLIGSVDIGARDTFGVYIDPLDAAGTRAYVPLWAGRKVVEIDLTNPAAPAVSRTFETDQNPQGIAFLDGQWLAVANDLGETISLVDRVSGEVKLVPVDFSPDAGGLDVSQVAFDPAASRLYALLSSINAVAAYDVDLAASPPAVTLAGRLPTGWWPSGVVVHPDGALTITHLRGRPIGVYEEEEKFGGPGNVAGHKFMRGSVQHVPAPGAPELAAGEVEVDLAVAVAEYDGYPEVQCPTGTMDFPVPPTNTMGPSKAIDRIIFIVRENKTFDAVFGDMPGVAGDPKYTLKATSADMDLVWTNLRDLARTFTNADNFYNVAVQSTQGHQWATYGRTTDFCERTWSADARPLPLCGVGEAGRPDAGSLFDWVQKAQIRYDVLGEIVGGPLTLPADYNPIDIQYPGGPFQNIPYPDNEKACHTAARMRVACDLGRLTFMTLPNDHTVGVDPGSPTPETMCAVNDEATGMVVDAISHSPFWKSSLVVITEDDPQQGGDHIDYHRTPLVLISPWVKRGYVTSTHIDMASLYKLFAHVLGLPYPSVQIARAGLPLDAFTSTPDYTPFEYTPRKWPLACGGAASKIELRVTRSWDFSYVDAQEGLGEQVARWMRGRQLEEMPPELEAQVKIREERKAAGLPPPPEDEDGDGDFD
jgi:DNA-binding beta-propeller fold protein YncE